MNYTKHYDRLIDRARCRQVEGYTELHHVLPKCMGGDNLEYNLVKLYPEEHYVAHQLLVKMYPNVVGLIWAAVNMSNQTTRRSNKLYGWLRRKLSESAKQRTGERNGSFGTRWIRHDETGDSIKVDKNDSIPDGWSIGRVVNKNNLSKKLGRNKCIVCGADAQHRTYCTAHAHIARQEACKRNAANGDIHKRGKIYINDGIRQKRICPTDPIPDGFVVGGISRKRSK